MWHLSVSESRVLELLGFLNFVLVSHEGQLLVQDVVEARHLETLHVWDQRNRNRIVPNPVDSHDEEDKKSHIG